MTRIHPLASEVLMLTLPCRRCGAAPGTWCYGVRQGHARELHVARWEAAVDAGLLPVGGPDRGQA